MLISSYNKIYTIIETCEHVDLPLMETDRKNPNPNSHFLKRKETNSCDLTLILCNCNSSGSRKCDGIVPVVNNFLSKLQIPQFF